MKTDDELFEEWFAGWYTIAYSIQERMTNPAHRGEARIPAMCAFLAALKIAREALKDE